MEKTRREWLQTLRLCKKAIAELETFGTAYQFFINQYQSLVSRIEKALGSNPDATTLKIKIKPEELSGLVGYR